ncbi:MAG: hypothetical protein AUK34_07530 [Ignavibacteria bacterium CG2_30_36_16]|nr:GlsB/YeaQ/YmgE family stress response membrane protein [Ignavibacteria bacterium]OIP59655.1 MAG: hypothetical protein AUK34_07530 [Ignavibacteria bacterium CG2_30_36_16]PJB00142.1 MAG: hypothetical protein CO127_09165 [Ignavibacteria bacterium CG_4_9_14_3_um_filter_36_18]
MSFLDIIILLVVAGLAGGIGKALSGFSRGGCFLSIIIGFIGALIGTWLARELKLPEIFSLNIGNTNFPVIWAIIGAGLFTAVLGLITSRKD